MNFKTKKFCSSKQAGMVCLRKIDFFNIKNLLFLYIIFLSIICSDSKTLVSKNGIRVESSLEYNIIADPHPVAKYKIYYNDRIVCSNCGAYFISPDSRIILYLKRPKGRILGEKIEVFYTEKVKKQDFLYIFSPITTSSKIEWRKNRISFTGNPYDKEMRYILYLEEGILEIKDTKSEIELFEYFVFIMKKLYQKIDNTQKKNLNDYFKDYIKLKPGGAKYKGIEKISYESWNKIGECCFTILDHLKDKNSSDLIFQVFKRSFNKYFIKKNNMWIIDRFRFYYLN